MVYIAHTTEATPVFREKATEGHYRNWLVAGPNSLKEYPIAPEYKDYWQDGQEVSKDEFELAKDNCGCGGNCDQNCDEADNAIPKQKQEIQKQRVRQSENVFDIEKDIESMTPDQIKNVEVQMEKIHQESQSELWEEFWFDVAKGIKTIDLENKYEIKRKQ